MTIPVESELERGDGGGSEEMLDVRMNLTVPHVLETWIPREDDEEYSLSISKVMTKRLLGFPMYDVNGQLVKIDRREMVHTYLKGSKSASIAERLGCRIDTGSAKNIDRILEKELKSGVFERSNFLVAYAQIGTGGDRIFFGKVTGDSAQSVALLKERL